MADGLDQPKKNWLYFKGVRESTGTVIEEVLISVQVNITQKWPPLAADLSLVVPVRPRSHPA